MFDFVMESCEDNISFEELIYIMEASNHDSYNLKMKIYPMIEKVLNTPAGKEKFKRLVSGFIDRNSAKLHTAGPQYLIVFNNNDKNDYFRLFDIEEKQIKDTVKEIVNGINDKADWKLVTNNPIFIIFYLCICYATIHDDKALLANGLAILSLAMYPSIFTKYYSFEPNPAIMNYTIDNLSNKFLIKKEKHIFGNLTRSINQSWSFHKDMIKTVSDVSCITFIMRIRNDQNSFMRKISNEYFENHKKGIGVYQSVDSYEDEKIVDIENDSSKVESVTNNIVMKLIINGVDIKLAEASAKSSKVSVIDTRNYLTEIITDKRQEEMKSLIESIIFLYLYENNNNVSDINSKDFLVFGLGIFKKSNSKDANVLNIKTILDKWAEEVGVTAQYTRVPTISDYKKAFYTFFVCCIQKYNN